MIEKLRAIAPETLENEPMSQHTTFRIGGPADYFVSVRSEKQLQDLIEFSERENLPCFVMGNGSNLLVSDSGIRGLVIELGKEFCEIKADGTKIYAQAGAMLSRVASVAMNNCLSGMEEISGIPGTLGGAVYMNAGAYGGEISSIIETVNYLDSDGKIKTARCDECEFGYRTSIFEKGDKVIVSAVLSLSNGNQDEIKAKMADYTCRRKTKQPLQYPSGGSTFKRPEGHFAGALIEEAGLKGFSVGGAQISELHAGFVINKGGATATDVLAVVRHAQETVWEKFGVRLETEIKLVGEGI